MNAIRLVRHPIALAALLCAAALANAAGSTASTDSAATAVAAASGTVRKVTLTTGMADGKMVYQAPGGAVNPVIQGKVGDTIELTISSGEGAEHDIVVPDLKVASKKFDGKSGATKVTFKLAKAGKFTYYCSIPGHRQIGMEGVIEVAPASGQAAAVVVPAAAVVKTAAPATRTVPDVAARIAPAAADAVSVVMDPAAVPAPLGERAPQLVKYQIETVELAGKLDDGTTFTYWTFGRKVPGPMLRVRQGDTVELTLSNAASSKAVHSIDLHAVTGGHGGGEHTQVPPGQARTFSFKALNPGLYVYHCATPSVPHHISAGMYGLILVEPPGGLPKVDREYYVMQGDLYTSHAAGTKGHHEYNPARADDELPTYYTFNGAVGALTKEFKLTAKVGETVRIYFGVGGPNKVSSFHVIGEVFDKVYREGSLGAVETDVQTTLVPPGGAAIVDFKVNYPGKFVLVDHALSRAGKGLAGTLEVTGEADPAIYRPHQSAEAKH